MRIRMNEIFVGIDGEVNAWGIGGWSVFLRLQGCSATCSFCDTMESKSFSGGVITGTVKILDAIRKWNIDKVTITGGEPFEQRGALEHLLTLLEEWGYRVSVETNGYRPLKEMKKLFPRVCFVADFKLEKQPPWQNFIGLKENDFIKILVSNREDLRHVEHISKFLLAVGTPQIAISPIRSETFSEKDIVDWIIKNKLFHFRLNTQLHKLLGLK